jgi:hypothetical protein
MYVLPTQQIFQQLKMSNFHKQCVYVKFCYKLGKKKFLETSETSKQVFGGEATSRTQTNE